MASNAEPIPVKDALRLCEMALDQEVWASPEPWQLSWAQSRMSEQDAHFIVLSRAVMRPLIEYVRTQMIRWSEPVTHDGLGNLIYPPLAALRDHYDRVRPDWRVSK